MHKYRIQKKAIVLPWIYTQYSSSMLNSITVFFFNFKNAPHISIHLNGSYADVMFNIGINTWK